VTTSKKRKRIYTCAVCRERFASDYDAAAAWAEAKALHPGLKRGAAVPVCDACHHRLLAMVNP
jgi:DNA-directed RNA polymerase subunit RPC12/RpoP